VRALVLDDSRAMRMVMARLLRERGWEVVEAGDGEEGLAVLKDGPTPELALVDWNMPVMNGLDFVRAVRKDPAMSAVTLVMVTTESEHSQVVRALAAGAHEYVFKPFTPEALLGKLSMLGLPVGA
jgi:two-component system, chemotaxis family, chemotaxis protein CheY